MSLAAKSAPSGGVLFATFLEALPDAIVTVVADGGILLVNSQAESLFGYARDELIGRHLEVLVPTSVRDHAQLRATYFHAPVPRPMGVGMELSGRRKDGSEFPAEIALAWIVIDDRLLVIASVRDITERKRAEAKFRSLLEAAPDAIVGVNPGGLIALVNTQAEALFGYERNQLIGRPVELLVPGAALNINSPSPIPGFATRGRDLPRRGSPSPACAPTVRSFRPKCRFLRSRPRTVSWSVRRFAMSPSVLRRSTSAIAWRRSSSATGWSGSSISHSASRASASLPVVSRTTSTICLRRSSTM